jgi:hypothetical protein
MGKTLLDAIGARQDTADVPIFIITSKPLPRQTESG